MKIYLDTCSLQRPLDSKTQVRIILEAEAVLGILRLCELGEVEIVSSEALLFEIKRNPNMTRRQFALEALLGARTSVALNEQVEERAKELNRAGIKPLDALHLASAEEAAVDYLCTCDDRFLKQAQVMKGLKVKVVSPIEAIEEIEKW
jgi:predicted nucleic acid-binding protein